MRTNNAIKAQESDGLDDLFFRKAILPHRQVFAKRATKKPNFLRQVADVAPQIDRVDLAYV